MSSCAGGSIAQSGPWFLVLASTWSRVSSRRWIWRECTCIASMTCSWVPRDIQPHSHCTTILTATPFPTGPDASPSRLGRGAASPIPESLSVIEGSPRGRLGFGELVRELAPRANAQLSVSAAKVRLDRAHTQEQPGRRLTIGEAGGDELRDLAFRLRQGGGVRCPAAD